MNNKEKKDRLKILSQMRETLYQNLEQIESSDKEKKFNMQLKFVERINAIIRLEQAEKRFDINMKLALLSLVTSILSAGFFSYLFN